MTTRLKRTILDVDALRKELSLARDHEYKSDLGQFLTPQPIAEFMASMFTKTASPIRLLDPGCGHGALSYAFANKFSENQLEVEGWEIDKTLHSDFQTVLASSQNKNIKSVLNGNDFIKEGVIRYLTENKGHFTHAILNPPYKKISAASETRQALKQVKIQSVNLYTAFLALSILLTNKSGEIVSITPRSFFNGSYYRPFRSFLLNYCSIDRIHLFDSRKKAFSEDNVLQENIVLKLTRGKKQGPVVISKSLDQNLSDYSEAKHPFEDVVFPNDDECYFHIPSTECGASPFLVEIQS